MFGLVLHLMVLSRTAFNVWVSTAFDGLGRTAINGLGHTAVNGLGVKVLPVWVLSVPAGNVWG